jgi:hypothetical protein
MDSTLIVGGLTAAAAYGLAIGTGLRLIPTARRASRDLREFSRSRDGVLERERLLQQQAQTKARRLSGWTRESSIVGLYGDVLRHADGSYTRGYDLPLQPTMLAPDEVTDAYIDGFADMLTVDLPAGTVLQFRYAVGPDPGRAIAEHLRARSYQDAYFPAARIHDLNLDFLKAMADTQVFRQEHASLFVRVPVSHENDGSLHGFNTFATVVISEWREHRFRGLKRRAAEHWSSSRNDGVVRRIREHEEESLRQAEKCFRLLEMQSPVSLQRLNREQLWRAVYQSHVTGSASIPRLPQYDGLDLRDYLCAETIEDRGWYVLHGIRLQLSFPSLRLANSSSPPMRCGH